MAAFRRFGVTVFLVVALGAGAVPRSMAARPTAIDCPPKVVLAVDEATALAGPTRAPVWRVDGVVRHLSLGGTVEVNRVTLHIDRRSLILVDCRRAVIRELPEGSMVAALSEERDGRNVILVIEGESDDR